MAQKKDSKTKAKEVQSKQPTAGEGAAAGFQPEQPATETASGVQPEQPKVKITTEDFDSFEATKGEIHIKFGESCHVMKCDVKSTNILIVLAALEEAKQAGFSQFMSNISPQDVVNTILGMSGLPFGIII